MLQIGGVDATKGYESRRALQRVGNASSWNWLECYRIDNWRWGIEACLDR